MAAPRITSESVAKALPALTAVVCVALAALVYFGALRPMLSGLMSGGRFDLAPTRAQIDGLKAYVNRSVAIDSDFQQVPAELKSRVSNAVPLAVDEPALYVTLETISNAHGILLSAVDVVPDDKSVTVAGRKLAKVTMHVEGATYQQFKSFLSDLERSERILDVQSVVFTPGTGAYDLALRAYWLDFEAAKASASGAAPAPATP